AHALDLSAIGSQRTGGNAGRGIECYGAAGADQSAGVYKAGINRAAIAGNAQGWTGAIVEKGGDTTYVGGRDTAGSGDSHGSASGGYAHIVEISDSGRGRG